MDLSNYLKENINVNLSEALKDKLESTCLKRRLLLFYNDRDVPQVKVIYANLKSYFMSPVGGFWAEDEIIGLNNSVSKQNEKDNLDNVLSIINAEDIDYSMVFFVGHGGIDKKTQKEVIELQCGNLVNTEIFIPCQGKKRTIILEACRNYVDLSGSQILEQRVFSGEELDGDYCKQEYNQKISEAEPHYEVLKSTQAGFKASANAPGSFFTDKIFDYIKSHNTSNVTTSYDGSINDLFNDIKSKMQAESLGIQIPDYKSSLSTSQSFPFYVMRKSESRIIEGGTIVEVIDD